MYFASYVHIWCLKLVKPRPILVAVAQDVNISKKPKYVLVLMQLPVQNMKY